jgi:dipeptidyl aminopeptidase/acylaminoacyl peptidase
LKSTLKKRKRRKPAKRAKAKNKVKIKVRTKILTLSFGGAMPSIKKPYGLWNSPINATALSRRIGLEELAWAGDGETLIWVESRSDCSGLVVLRPGGARREIEDVYKIRGGIGYGGGELAASGETIFFAEAGGRIYSRSTGSGGARPITPAHGAAASPTPSPDGHRLLFVYSDGTTDLLALVDAQGREWPRQLARGADFYMQPAWHPGGEWIAWVEWDHPNMPWDGTRVMLAQFHPQQESLGEVKQIGGGADTAAAQPLFSPDGSFLAFIEAGGEWHNLILLNMETGHRTVLYAAGADLMPPAWVQGNRSLAWAPDGNSLYTLRSALGRTTLLRIGLDGNITEVNLAPYTWLAQLSVSARGTIALLAAGEKIPTRLIVLADGRVQIAAHSDAETTPPDYLPVPQPIEWRSPDGATVHGIYFPPTNPDFHADGRPPAILHIHGGPTSAVSHRYNAEAAYNTSRGYGVLEVNYRGSTGYGRAYRDALRQRWGHLDVEDAVSGGAALGALGLAHPSRLVIKGGSAGGYTVLNSLVRYPGRFKAGICLFGVSNLFTLDLDTHKFEAHYTSSLVGQLPEAAGRYHEWSPAFHADRIRDPLYIFQGSEDKVVPPAQSEEIVAALRKTGVTHQYKLYPGEGHGFRKSENVADYFKETERFLMMHVLFAP